MTHDELIPHYTRLHADTNYGYYPMDYERASAIEQFLAARLALGATVLDCSAGRGLLVRALQQRGYVCTTTEADPYLVQHDLRQFTPQLLRYDQLDMLAPAQWDAVVSSDVLEHLLTEDEVRAALRALAARSRRWLCVTAGVTPSSAWRSADSVSMRLHHVVRRADWWRTEVARVATIVEEGAGSNSWYGFAEVITNGAEQRCDD